MKARRSKTEWQELILRQVASGLSAQQFCRDIEVCPKYFSVRKKQLGLRPSAFVPVIRATDAHPDTPVATLKTSPLVLRHGGCCLHFESMPDSAWLAQLVGALA